MNTTRVLHAPSTSLPELAEFLAPFHVHSKRSEGRQSLERYLTEPPKKSCDTIAQVVPGTSEQRLQALMTGRTSTDSGARPCSICLPRAAAGGLDDR